MILRVLLGVNYLDIKNLDEYDSLSRSQRASGASQKTKIEVPTMTFHLPPRRGERPLTGDTIPHLQHSQKSPDSIREALKAWALRVLPDVREEDTRISVASTRAFWLAEDVDALRSDAFMPPAGGREFAHLHADGSLHLCVSDAVVQEIVSSGWGEPHPLRDQGVNEVLLYAPREESELEIAKFTLAQSYRYATGRAVSIEGN